MSNSDVDSIIDAGPEEGSLKFCQGFGRFIVSKLSSTDEVQMDSALLYLLTRSFRVMEESTCVADPFPGEKVFLDWAAIWLMKGSTKYYNMSLNHLDAVFLDMDPVLFQQVRMSKYVLLQAGDDHKLKEAMHHTLDGMLEDLNGRHKKLNLSDV